MTHDTTRYPTRAPNEQEAAREKATIERERFEERAAIMEFDGGLTRADAERRAREQSVPDQEC